MNTMQSPNTVVVGEAHGNMKRVTGFLCGPRLYEFDGWFFEVSPTGGPWPLKNDGELRKRASKVFYKMYEKFDKLSVKEKQKYRVGGGCIPI